MDQTISFRHSKLNSVFSRIIATRPYPITLELFHSTIDSNVFLKHLQDRTDPFGSLSLIGSVLETNDLRRLFNHFHLFEHLRADDMPGDLVLQLLAAPVKSIGFRVDTETGRMDVGTATIVPKEIAVHTSSVSDFPTKFMRSFLDRIAQLGHLEQLKISAWDDTQIPLDVGKALIHAVGANKKLTTFKLYDLRRVWDSCLQDLFAAFERHEGFCALRLQYYPKSLDPHFSWLKQLLNRNRRVEITDLDNCEWDMDDEMEQISSLNRFFLGSKSMTREPPTTRLSLLGAALTNSATRDLQRIGLLLSDHTDLLCEVVCETVCISTAEFDGDSEANEEDEDLPLAFMSVASLERDAERKRKRTAGF